YVKAFMLKPETFGCAPLFLLTTDIPENDYLSRTITHKLYEAHEETRIAQEIVLGIGGTKVIEKSGFNPDIYHMNEGHALPLAFYLYSTLKSRDKVKERLVFTTHTPEKAGNEEHDIHLLSRMGFFDGLGVDKVRELSGMGTHDNVFSLTVGALRFSKIANAVSKKHCEVANEMWKSIDDICPITGITNAQNRKYWTDKPLTNALEEHDDYGMLARKRHLKRRLFDVVADQTGKMFDPEVLTFVWARRFAEYKRAGLIKKDFERFRDLVTRSDKPIQIIWAGKPHPNDTSGINLFNELVYITRELNNCAVLVHYELDLSILLKKGCDVWLNTPRVTREASGTSGMSAAMNGAVNLSINDGWYLEFEKHGINGFTIYQDGGKDIVEQDEEDFYNLMRVVENEVIPIYYTDPARWLEIMKNSITDVVPFFDSGRMADEYYRKLYNYEMK
ncbi:MAG: alpha-glucan family phosphorylase, partial [Campylobacterales bacterium]